MKGSNHSKQRDAIYNYICSTKSHPTAEAVYEAVCEDFPKISLATVYRNLQLLEETGSIQKIPSFDAKDHYDGNVSEHPHFECRSCGAVIDLDMDNLDFLKTLGSQGFDGKIEQTQLVFFGQCGKCCQK